MHGKYSISKTILVNARAEIVFKILIDVGNWRSWTRSIKRIELLNKKNFEIGTKVKVVQPKLLPITWEVTELEKDKSFTWVSNSIGLKMTARHILVQGDKGTFVELTTIYEGILSGLIYKITAALTDEYMTMEIDGLKEEAEKENN
jgi:uncharacterized membrane protein